VQIVYALTAGPTAALPPGSTLLPSLPAQSSQGWRAVWRPRHEPQGLRRLYFQTKAGGTLMGTNRAIRASRPSCLAGTGATGE
jgi:hypothetical protein